MKTDNLRINRDIKTTDLIAGPGMQTADNRDIVLFSKNRQRRNEFMQPVREIHIFGAVQGYKKVPVLFDIEAVKYIRAFDLTGIMPDHLKDRIPRYEDSLRGIPSRIRFDLLRSV